MYPCSCPTYPDNAHRFSCLCPPTDHQEQPCIVDANKGFPFKRDPASDAALAALPPILFQSQPKAWIPPSSDAPRCRRRWPWPARDRRIMPRVARERDSPQSRGRTTTSCLPVCPPVPSHFPRTAVKSRMFWFGLVRRPLRWWRSRMIPPAWEDPATKGEQGCRQSIDSLFSRQHLPTGESDP